jgi:hypothetical protein
VTHAAYLGETLCGWPVGSAKDGWEENQYARNHVDAAFVTCRRCRQTLESEAYLKAQARREGW